MLLLGGITALLIILLVYVLTGFGYTIARIRCGHQPTVHVRPFGGEDQTYYTPGNDMYRFYAHEPFTDYYCSETDAQAAGLSKAE